MSLSILPMFSSKSFKVSGLTFRSLIHFGFIFLYGVRQFSNFILLHVAVLFFWHQLLKRVSFSTVYSCFFCHRLGDHGYLALSLDFLSCSIDLHFCFVPVSHCFDDCSFIVLSEVREPDSSSSILLSQDSFGFSGSFVSLYKYKNSI